MTPNRATNKAAKLYLQESFTNSVAMYVIYAPMDVVATQYLSDGKDEDNVPILPCGFAILPDKANWPFEESANGNFGGGIHIVYHNHQGHLHSILCHQQLHHFPGLLHIFIVHEEHLRLTVPENGGNVLGMQLGIDCV
nr:homeobox-leucine zipper protein PROTODERMAL FACTOR 2-like [Ipomoea batatas]